MATVFTYPVFHIDETDPPGFSPEGTQSIYINYALEGEEHEKDWIIECLRAHPATGSTEEEIGFGPTREDDPVSPLEHAVAGEGVLSKESSDRHIKVNRRATVQQDEKMLAGLRRYPIFAFDVPRGWLNDDMTVLTIP